MVIPKSINGKAVVAIDEYAFSPFTDIDEICKYQNSLIENKSEELSNKVFEFQKKMMDEEDFHGDILDFDREYIAKNSEPLSKITSIYIPSSIEFIGPSAFSYCDNVKEISVYGDTEKEISIDYDCFDHCISLVCLNGTFIPLDNSMDIQQTYQHCFSLKQLTLYPVNNEENKLYVKIDWLPHGGFNLETEAYEYNLEKLILAEGTKSLAGGVEMSGGWRGKSLSVKEIYIPASVEKIEPGCFINETCDEIEKLDEQKFEETGKGINLETDATYKQDITIITPKGSYAEKFAKEHGIPYKNE